MTKALEYAQKVTDHIQTEKKGCQKSQDELEKVMTLFLYDDLSQSTFKDLVEEDSRKRLASKVNQEILSYKGFSSELLL